MWFVHYVTYVLGAYEGFEAVTKREANTHTRGKIVQWGVHVDPFNTATAV